MNECICILTRTCTYIHIQIYIYAYAYMRAVWEQGFGVEGVLRCMNACAYLRVLVHIYIDIFTYVHIHICVRFGSKGLGLRAR